MAGKIIVIDGPTGMVKSTLIDALRHRLGDDDISVSVSLTLNLLDCLVNSSRVQEVHKASLGNRVVLADTNHIYELAADYYGSHKLDDYDALSKAIDLSALNLKPDLVVLIDSMNGDISLQDVERGYVWEAKQRGYQVMSTIGDIEPVFKKVIELASKSKNQEPTAVAQILSKKKLPRASKENQTKNEPSEPKKSKSKRSRRARRR